VAAVAALLAVYASPARAWTDAQNRITFTKSVNGIVEVFTMLPDGKGVTQVTRGGPSKKCDPAMSPDGRWIAYAANDGHFYVVPSTGGTPVNLTPNLGVDDEGGRRPTWSRDGNSIVFHLTDGQNKDAAGVTQPDPDRSTDLRMVTRAATSATGRGWPKPLTDIPGRSATAPRHSPDARWLAFTYKPNINADAHDIWVMPAPVPGQPVATSVPGMQVTKTGSAGMASWAPSSTRMAYVSFCGALYTVPITTTATSVTVSGAPTKWATTACMATYSSTSDNEIVYDTGGTIYKRLFNARKATSLGAGGMVGW